MRCRHFLSFVSVALLAFFFGLFITIQNSYALDDLSITIDSTSSFSRGDSVFPDCDSSCFSNYHYFKFEVLSYVLYSTSDFRFTFVIPGYSNKNFYLPSFTSSYISLTSDISSILYYSESVPSGFSYRLSLSDSLPSPDCPDPPSGDLSITSNGTYDVSSYATAIVDVPAEVIEGDYHDDLVSIQKSIIICGAILLVLYFFYCIYRLIIKNSGVK